jgi:molecular chaperone DnaK (HSP70)
VSAVERETETHRDTQRHTETQRKTSTDTHTHTHTLPKKNSIKRLIGRQFTDKTVQHDKKLLPYTIVSKVNFKKKMTLGSTAEGRSFFVVLVWV